MSNPLDPSPHDPGGPPHPADRLRGDSGRDHGDRSVPPGELPVTDYAPPGPRGSRRNSSPVLIIAGVALGLLILGALLVWLVMSLVSGLGYSLNLGGDPEGSRQPAAPAPTGGRASGARSPGEPVTTGPRESGPAAAPSRSMPSGPAASAPEGAATLRVPESGALVSTEGTFREMVLEEDPADAIKLPEHDGPLLVVWSNSSPRDSGTFFLTGYDRPGGRITEALSVVRAGRTGMQLIDLGPEDPRTRVLFPQGNRDVSWRVRVFPFSALPEAERGRRVTGNGPAALRLPAGKAGDYRLSVKGEGVPRIEVYDADDLELSTQFEYGTAPVDLDVTVGAGEQIIQIDADAEWLLEPR